MGIGEHPEADRFDGDERAVQQQHVRSAALDAIRAELDALELDKTPVYTMSASFAAPTAIDAFDRCASLMPTIERMPDLDVPRLKRIVTYANALLYCNARVNAYQETEDELGDVVEAAREMRGLLLDATAVPLRKKRLLASVVDELRKKTAPSDLVDVLGSLYELLSPFGGSYIDQSDLDEANRLVDELAGKSKAKNRQDVSYSSLVDQRRKVGALLAAAYKDLRAAVSFIRREQEDQDDFAPAIRGGGRPAKRAKAEEPEKPEEPKEPSKPADPEKPRSLTRGLVDEPSDDPFDQGESK